MAKAIIKRRSAASTEQKAARNDAAQIALFHLSNQMRSIASASSLLRDSAEGKLGEASIDDEDLIELCGGVIYREAQALYDTWDELKNAFGVEFSYWPAKELADKAEVAEHEAAKEVAHG